MLHEEKNVNFSIICKKTTNRNKSSNCNTAGICSILTPIPSSYTSAYNSSINNTNKIDDCNKLVTFSNPSEKIEGKYDELLRLFKENSQRNALGSSKSSNFNHYYNTNNFNNPNFINNYNLNNFNNLNNPNFYITPSYVNYENFNSNDNTFDCDCNENFLIEK